MTLEHIANLRRALLQQLKEVAPGHMKLSELHEGARFISPQLTVTQVRDELSGLEAGGKISSKASGLLAGVRLYSIEAPGLDALSELAT